MTTDHALDDIAHSPLGNHQSWAGTGLAHHVQRTARLQWINRSYIKMKNKFLRRRNITKRYETSMAFIITKLKFKSRNLHWYRRSPRRLSD
jgi:hypothetical protein